MTAAGLTDSYQLMTGPVVTGAGSPLSEGLPFQQDLELPGVTAMKHGAIPADYRPVR